MVKGEGEGEKEGEEGEGEKEEATLEEFISWTKEFATLIFRGWECTAGKSW